MASRSNLFGLTNQQIEDLKEAFDLFDVSGDGRVGAEELSMVLRAIGRNSTTEDAEKIIKDIEARKPADEMEGDDHPGELDINEFLELMAQEIKDSHCDKDELEEAFERFGAKTIDDYLTHDKLKKTFASYQYNIPDEDITYLLEKMGANP